MDRLDLPLTSVKPYSWLAVRLLVIFGYFIPARMLTAHHSRFWFYLAEPVVAALAVGTMILIRKVWLGSRT